MGSVLYPAKNEEIDGIVSYPNFPCDFSYSYIVFKTSVYVGHKCKNFTHIAPVDPAV